MSRLGTIVLLLVLTGSAAAAPVALGREDIAQSWLRLERELRTRTLTQADRARLGQQFDVKTRAFFRGGFGEVVRGIDGITAELRGTSATTGPAAFAMAFRVRVEPAVWVIGKTKEAKLTGGAIYGVELPDEGLGKLRLRLLGPDGTTQKELPIRNREFAATFALAPTGLAAGIHRLRITGPDGIDEPAGRLPVLAEHPDATRKRNEKRIAALPKDAPIQAVATVRARNALIVENPAAGPSYGWLRGAHDQAREVDAEIEALAKGKDPYAGRTGDHWRVVEVNGETVPCRIFVPKDLGEKPAPLVFFLHGAGADENAFFEGYGAGVAKELAAQRKFIAVAPQTIPISRKAGAFTALLDTVLAGYRIDESRVYVVGHSLGAFATGFLCRAHGKRIAAACQIAGGTGRTGEKGPPVLFILAGRDQILRLKAPAETDLVTVRRYPDEAHTWVVPRALPGILDWLFTHPKSKR